MKTLLRHLVINTFSLYVVTLITSGIVFRNGITTLFIAGAALTVTTVFARPIINILLLPLNLITFGFFRWVSSAIALYLVTLLVPAFKVTGFHFTGLASKWLDIPALHFEGIIAYIAFSLVLSIITSFIYWLIK